MPGVSPSSGARSTSTARPVQARSACRPRDARQHPAGDPEIALDRAAAGCAATLRHPACRASRRRPADARHRPASARGAARHVRPGAAWPGAAASVAITCWTVPMHRQVEAQHARRSARHRRRRNSPPARRGSAPAAVGHGEAGCRRGRWPGPRRPRRSRAPARSPADAAHGCRAAGRSGPRAGAEAGADEMRAEIGRECCAARWRRADGSRCPWPAPPPPCARAQANSASVSRQHQPAFGADAAAPRRPRPRSPATARCCAGRAAGGRSPGRGRSRRRNHRCRSWTCRLPALAVLAAMPASPRSDHQHVDALPRQVQRGGEAERAAADDQDVAARRRRDRGGRDAALQSGAGSGRAGRFGLRQFQHQRRGGHRLHRGARRGEAGLLRHGAAEPGEGGAAHPPLAAAHAGARRLLQRAERGRALRLRRAQGAGRHLLAAAEDGAVGDVGDIEGRRGEDPPERRLEGRAPGAARPAPPASSGAAKPRSRAAASPASRPRARATRAPPIAAPSPMAKTSGQRGAAILRRHRLQPAEAIIRRSGARRPAPGPGRFPAGSRG